MSTKNQYLAGIYSDIPRSLFFWAIMIISVLIVMISPFYKALFNGGSWAFEGPIYNVMVWSSVAFLLLSVHIFKEWSFCRSRDLLVLLVWLIPLSFLISSIQAVTQHGAINSIGVHAICAIFFMIGLYYGRTQWGLNIIVYSIMISGYIVVIYGLMNWLGYTSYSDAVLGKQLSGVFQYPNTYAAYLTGIFLGSLHLVGVSTRWSSIWLHGLIQTPILLSILLTLSRGGWLILALMIVVFIVFLPPLKQLQHLAYMLSLALISFVVYVKYMEIRTDFINVGFNKSDSAGGVIWIVVASIVSSVIALIIYRLIGERLFQKVKDKKMLRGVNMIIPTVIVLLGCIAVYVLFVNTAIVERLPESISSRIGSINLNDQSTQERMAFFKDAMKIVKDYPVLGAGGGAWSALYYEYQSFEYISSQAHYFILQYFIEVGWVGIIILIVFLFAVFVLFIRNYSRETYNDYSHHRYVLFIIAVSLLAHSQIDFDLSFVYIGIVVYICLGGMLPPKTKDFKLIKFKNVDKWSRVVPVVLSISSIVLIVMSIRLSTANSTYQSAIEELEGVVDYQSFTSKIDKALNYHPNHPDYIITKVSIETQAYAQLKDEKHYQEASYWLSQLDKYEPRNKQIVPLRQLLDSARQAVLNGK